MINYLRDYLSPLLLLSGKLFYTFAHLMQLGDKQVESFAIGVNKKNNSFLKQCYEVWRDTYLSKYIHSIRGWVQFGRCRELESQISNPRIQVEEVETKVSQTWMDYTLKLNNFAGIRNNHFKIKNSNNLNYQTQLLNQISACNQILRYELIAKTCHFNSRKSVF